MLANNPLLQYVAKLERRAPLPLEARDALLALPVSHREYASNDVIVAAGSKATYCVMIESGLVSRAKSIDDGKRQIVAFHVPGDAVDLQTVLFARSDHDIRSHTQTRVCLAAHTDILALTRDYPVLANALWLDTLVDSAIFREWTVNVGQRNARERIAHLLLEMAARFEPIGLVSNDSFDFPVTQTNLAEALGLSLVHLNKSLQSLSKAGYLVFKERRIVLKKRAELIEIAGFHDDYLYLNHARIKDPAIMEESDAA